MTEGQRSCAYSNCNRVPHKTSGDGRCIFHAKAEDKSEEEIKGSLRDYISEIKKKDSDYNFSGFVFVGDIDFKKDFGVTVFKKASFVGAVFEGGALFKGAVFKGSARFVATKFKGRMAVFARATFEGEANFCSTSFYNRSAIFFEAVFKGSATFQSAFFEGRASFPKTIFEGYANFIWVRFKNDVSFEGAIFSKYTSFEQSEFHKRTIMAPGYTGEVIKFNNAVLENVSLGPLHLDKEAVIDFRGARIRNTDVRSEYLKKHILQEREKDFREAKEIYLLLKNNFHTIGRYEDESWAFMQEKEMERRSFFHYRKEYKEQELGEKLKNRSIKDSLYCLFLAYVYSGVYADERMTEWSQSDGISAHIRRLDRLFPIMINHLRHPIEGIKSRLKSYCSFLELNRRKRMGKVSPRDLLKVFWFYMKYPVKYAWSTFLKWLYGWGEWPWLILAWCVATIFIFSVLYCFIGDIASATNLPIVNSYSAKLYFSGITFTTLGFGGYSPAGGAKALAFIESFLGIFSIALFVYSFARRTAGK